ncbi:zinc finger protein 845-like [Engraulis encrasicolus]|uniref:zinc finger protein 845-like n=1 Tax=Engraulis encrasicolus TaxID=184585 RepID=UPI002FD63DC3
MEQPCTAKEEPGLHLSALRLVNSPLRLICATIWRVVQEMDVFNYGILEGFLTLIAESVPDLLSQRQWAQLILGLRAKTVLELCRCDSPADPETIQHHLDRMRLPVQSWVKEVDVEASESNFLALVDILLTDPVEREIFFQEVFPVDYGPKYDLALQRLISMFVTRFEELLPMPRIDKLAAMLCVAPSIMEECVQTLSNPEELLNSLSHLKNHAENETKGSSPSPPLEEDDYIFSCLSHPPIVQVVMDTEHKACDIESSYCEEVSVECEEVSVLHSELQPDGIKIESESREELVETADSQHGLTYHPQTHVGEDAKDNLSKQMMTNPGAQGLLRAEESASSDIKFIREDGMVVNAQGLAVESRAEGVETTGHEEGLLSAEIQPKEEINNSCQIASDNRTNGICHQRRLAVKLERVDITGKPLPLLTRQSGRVRKKRVKLLWRKNKGPEIAWIVPGDEPNPATKLQHSVTTAKRDKLGSKLAAVVFTCSKCSFHHASQAILHKHLMKDHPDVFSRLLSAGFSQKKVAELHGEQGGQEDSSVQQLGPAKGGSAKTCPVCRKIFTRGTDMRRHLKSHLTEQLHFCSGCGRCFQYIEDLKRHTAVCKDVVPDGAQPNEEPQKTGDGVKNTGRVLDSVGEESTRVSKASSTITEQTANEAVDPRACPVCCLVLARASDMERHMRSHSAEKPYECLHCDKSYRYPYNLKKHVDFCHKDLNPSVKETDKQSCDSVQDELDTNLTQRNAAAASKVCPTCKKTFTRATDMRRHQKCHAARHFECLKCGESFPHSAELKKHSQNCCTEPTDNQGVVSSKRPLVCGKCGKKFFFMTHFQRHMRAHRQSSKPTKRWHKCAKCEEIFRTLYDLGKHQRCHWGDDPLRCTQCGRRFSHSVQLTSHKQIHSQTCATKCTMCDETFKEIASFRLHYLEAHNIKGSYPCSNCKKTFTEVCPLVQHLRTHTGERPYQCPQCPKSFPTPAKLSMHKRTHGHGGVIALRERRHLCHECGKCFYTAAELKRHEGSHRDERPHTCTHCGKGFKELRTLKAHMECHVDSQERQRHPCSFCGKTFIKAGALVRHNRIHTGERPHRCDSCNKSFLTHSEVLKHMRFHTGERPFKCQLCDKSFTQSCYLTAHMRTHTGEKPYACSMCEKRFADSAHRKRHMLIHTGEKPHVCERCGRAFNRKNLLNVHLKTCTL